MNIASLIIILIKTSGPFCRSHRKCIPAALRSTVKVYTNAGYDNVRREYYALSIIFLSLHD